MIVAVPEWAAEAARADAAGPSLRRLAATEAMRQVRSPLLWIGTVLTVVVMAGTTTDYSASSYEEKIASFMPIVLASMLAGYRSGRRDEPDALAEAAPLDTTARAGARLAGLAVHVAMGGLIAIGLAVVSRIEGGFWFGDPPRRRDDVLHPLLELLQPPLVIALAAAFGLAAARLRGRRALAVLIVGLLGGFLSFPGWWVMNIPPAHAVAFLQIQPMKVDLGTDIDPTSLPRHWLVNAPDEHSEGWDRLIVHQPTVAGHHLYLAGLVTVVAATAVRSRRARQLAVVGAGTALVGIAVQLAVMPSGIM